jgi:hypothetical protein
LRDRAGAAGSLRAYRNAVVFILADTGAVEELKDRVRAQLALIDRMRSAWPTATLVDLPVHASG